MLRELSNSKLLASILQRNSNNIDLFRLVAACLVIYGHAFAVAPEQGRQDLLLMWTGYASAGMAVKTFFFLSGLLVTSSLLQKKSVTQFLLARFFRIWPGLALVLISSSLVIGSLYTTLGLDTYFSSPNTYLYVKRMLLMNSWGTQNLGYYDLPGVFGANPYKSTVNASLWSLVIEVYAYLLVAGIYLVGLAERRIATALIILVFLDSILPSRILFSFLPQGNEDFSYLPFCFASGAFMAIHKDRIQISIGVPLGFMLLLYLFHGTMYARYCFYLIVFTGSCTCRRAIG